MMNSLFKKLTVNSKNQLQNKYLNETETKEGKLGMSIISSQNHSNSYQEASRVEKLTKESYGNREDAMMNIEKNEMMKGKVKENEIGLH